MILVEPAEAAEELRRLLSTIAKCHGVYAHLVGDSLALSWQACCVRVVEDGSFESWKSWWAPDVLLASRSSLLILEGTC